MSRSLLALVVSLSLVASPAAQEKAARPSSEQPAAPWSADTWSGLALRGIGPALTSGRIADIAVDPTRPSRWVVAVASGGVWITGNAGTSWTPVFDDQPSFSIGCVTLDPRNPHVIWIGTGENNNQRSVAYGDGVYRSLDGGKSWTRMGLERSEHIAKILIHPEDSDVIYVAAQGPLWSSGGDRGLYRSEDGGKTWDAVLTVDEHTGVTDVVMDPRDPNVLIAATHQRQRRVWTLIGGGPGSAIHKSTDGGDSWRKVTRGLPKRDMGRAGLAISPVDPDVVFAVIDAEGDEAGFYRSTDRGETWEKRSGYQSGGNYYNEIVADLWNADRVYAMDTFLQVTDDGGKTFRNLGETFKHVDNHAMWLDPSDRRHYLVGSDGGLYETFDAGTTWDYVANLPITQFYRITVDEASPVYNVYGGTQDNFTLGGPSRTLNAHGIANSDWFVAWGGDGFHVKADPTNPDIVYATLQYGVLSRFDRKSGESLLIQPQEAAGDPALRWNWDSPLLISPHNPARLYFAANRVYRSDDRGAGWRAVSPDLTRQIDRNRLEVMGRVWPPDTVARGASTSFYGNIVSLDESPRAEGLLYAGTDDGLVQVSEDGGGAWRRVEQFPGVPDRTYVSDVTASQHDASVVYAAFNNHKSGDFKPYLLRSGDRGRTWTSIASNLPGNGSVWTIVEDHVDPSLLFVGTEFGLFVSRDRGASWIRLKGGLPTIAVRDLAIQKREHDLVVGTFGRGIYVLDDYSPLRHATPAALEQTALVFPVRAATGFIPATPLGLRGKSFQGESYFTAPNPPFGAVFTYYLKDEIKSRKAKRQAAEAEAAKAKTPPAWPTRDEVVAEAREEKPAVVITVTDADGQVVQRLTGPVGKGVHRVAWDLRFPPSTPTSLRPLPTDNPFFDPPAGPMVVPGTYMVSIATRVDGVTTPVGEPQAFEVRALARSSLPEADRPALLAFQRKVARLQRAVLGAAEAAKEARTRVEHLVKAFDATPAAPPALRQELTALDTSLRDLLVDLEGDRDMRRMNEPVPPSLLDRVSTIVNTQWTSTSPATETSRQAYDTVAAAFGQVLAKLRAVVEEDLRRAEASMEAAGAPWTPGRVPAWTPEP